MEILKKKMIISIKAEHAKFDDFKFLLVLPTSFLYIS